MRELTTLSKASLSSFSWRARPTMGALAAREVLRPCANRHQPVRNDRLGLALQLERRQRLDRYQLAEQLDRFRPEEDLVGLRGLLQTSSDVDRVTRCQPFLRSRDDLAGVDTDPHSKPRAEVAFQLFVQGGDSEPKICCGSHAPKRIVLVNHRNAEDGHHRVADELLDNAAVALHGFARHIEVARQHVPKTLRIQPLAERRRSADVAEEHRDRLALLSNCLRRLERSCAGVAEAGSSRISLATLCADSHVAEARAHADGLQHHVVCSTAAPENLRST